MSSAARLYPRHSRNFKPLAGVRITTLAVNLPGPAAAARLHALGAQVRKIEPPGGDPMAQMSPAFYRAMHKGIRVQTLDLKTEQGQAALHAHRWCKTHNAAQLTALAQQHDLPLWAWTP